MLGRACSIGVQSCIDNGTQYFKDWMNIGHPKVLLLFLQLKYSNVTGQSLPDIFNLLWLNSDGSNTYVT